MAQRLARGAHNSEVTRSKRVAGIFITSHWCIEALEQLYYRDGAEEAREAHNLEDVGSRPTSGIFHLGSFKEAAPAVTTANQSFTTGMAQRERAGLITPRT